MLHGAHRCLSGGTPAASLAEYVAWVKKNGEGQGAVGIPAPASTPEFLVKVIGEKYGLDLVPAPYRDSAPMIGDMLGTAMGRAVEFMPHAQLASRERAYAQTWAKIIQASGFQPQ